MKPKIRAIVNRKDINEKISCIYCDERPYFYIQQSYIKNDFKSKENAEKEFWRLYEKEIINFNIIN